MAIIYLYDSTVTDFTYNGQPLNKAYEVVVDNMINDSFFVTFNHPLDDKGKYKIIEKDKIIKVHTPDGMQPFRIMDRVKYMDHVSIEAWPLFYADMRNKLVKPLTIRGLSGQAAVSAFVNNLLIDTPFTFTSNITVAHDYHTQNTEERENNPNQMYNALDVFKDIVKRWQGELVINGYDVRVVNRLGKNTGALLYEKKNISDFTDEESIQDITTRLYGKSEWTERPQGSDEEVKHEISVKVESPLINAYSGIVFEKQYTNNDIRTEKEMRDWLNLKFTTENIDKPSRNIKVNTNIVDDTVINLGDSLVLKYVKHDVDMEIRMVGYTYDGYANRYITIQLGDAKQSYVGNVQNTVREIETNVNTNVKQTVNQILNANGERMIYSVTKPIGNFKNGDVWFDQQGGMYFWDEEKGMWIDHPYNRNMNVVAEKVEDADKKADEAVQAAKDAVEQIDTAVANAGFTSLDETIQNMNYITMTAEQNAQEAISNASNAYDLAQSSISEAQTAQANSLDALGKADNALDGVSRLDVRVDDVEAELELKADNTFMNDDGTLTTLSNAITFNANRFSSNMQRIESRVESLAGEINLVILRGSIESKLLYGGETFPNAPNSSHSNVMGELIEVVGGESFALSKEMTGLDDRWRINFYDENHNFISRFHHPANTQDIMTAPLNARYMWVSYPKDSKPQITRGTDFIPYRPNMADQMTSDEMVIFRNEYDEYADRTERRLTAIDSEGGSLDVLSNKIITTADSVTKAMSALINTKVDDDEFTEFYQNEYLETAGEVSRKISLSDVKLGTRNLIKDSNDMSKVNLNSYQMTNRITTTQTPDKNQSTVLEFGRESLSGWLRLNPFNFELGEEYTFSVWIKRSTNGGSLPINIGVGVEGLDSREHQKRFNVGVEWQRVSITAPITRDVNVYNFVELRPQDNFLWDDTSRFYIWRPQLEKGNIASDWYPAPEDAEARINHVQTEWTQTFNTFEQTITGEGGINSQLQTLDSTISSIADPKTGRLSVIEQNLNGVQSEVYNADGSSKVTQIAEGVRTLSEEVLKPIGKLSDSWSSGVNISITRPNLSLMRVYHSVNNDSHTQTNNRIWRGNIVEGTTYTVVMRVRKVEGGPAYLTFGQAHTGTNRGYQFTVWRGFQTLTGTYTAVNNNSISIFFHTAGVYEFEELSIYPGGGASSGQLSVLNDNINLRVSKGELLSQINIEAEGILIQSGTNKLNITPTTTYIEDATIKSAMIESLEADKIKTGTLDAGKVKVINIDAENITSNVTDFIKSNWNEATGGGVTITGGGVRAINSEGSRVTLEDGVVSVGNRVGVNLGFIGDHKLDRNSRDAITITASWGTQIALIMATSQDGKTFKKAMSITSGGTQVNMFAPIDMNYNNIMNASNIKFLGGTIKSSKYDEDKYMTIDGPTGVSLDNAGITRMAVQSTIHFFTGANFRGNDITEVGKLTYKSDQRLKTNIKETNIRALDAIRNWKLVSYDWLESGEHVEIGLIAQNSPEIMTYNDESDIYGIDAGKQTMINTLAIQQLDSKTDDEISRLKAQIASLQDELALLKGA